MLYILKFSLLEQQDHRVLLCVKNQKHKQKKNMSVKVNQINNYVIPIEIYMYRSKK